ncbi:hypothetical protein Tco_0269218 [Tanacetum coccineum]
MGKTRGCLSFTRGIDHNLWDVIVNGDLEEEHTPTGENSATPAPKDCQTIGCKRNLERQSNQGLEVMKNQEDAEKCSKKSLVNWRFMVLQLYKEDINQKFLRSLPPAWNQITLIMRNKPDIDEIDIDDLYNNLRVYEDEMKRSSSFTSTSHNLAFLSSENTSSTNEVCTASGDFRVSTVGEISQVSTTPCAHDIDEDDLEELDLRWQVAMLTVRVKKFIQKI